MAALAPGQVLQGLCGGAQLEAVIAPMQFGVGLLQEEGPGLLRIGAGGEQRPPLLIGRDPVIDGDADPLPPLVELQLVHPQEWVGRAEQALQELRVPVQDRTGGDEPPVSQGPVLRRRGDATLAEGLVRGAELPHPPPVQAAPLVGPAGGACLGPHRLHTRGEVGVRPLLARGPGLAQLRHDLPPRHGPQRAVPVKPRARRCIGGRGVGAALGLVLLGRQGPFGFAQKLLFRFHVPNLLIMLQQLVPVVGVALPDLPVVVQHPPSLLIQERIVLSGLRLVAVQVGLQQDPVLVVITDLRALQINTAYVGIILNQFQEGLCGRQGQRVV
mmetsp:Transcript_137723/g.239474  ORF Transcript_137723/g.239474 Transcript_137723/m.239474 type:complete len:328 (+) Transcript_137723:1811-2794(+)